MCSHHTCVPILTFNQPLTILHHTHTLILNSGDGLRSKEAFPSRQENQQDSPPSRQNVVLSGFGATGGAVGTTGALDTDNTPLPAQEMYDHTLQ